MALRPRSTVKRLPDEVKAAIDERLRDGKWSLDELTEYVRGRGADVSRSALGRYSQGFDRVAEDIRFSREVAQQVGAELKGVRGDAGRLVIESLQALLLRAHLQMSDGDTVDPDELSKLSRAAKDLQGALRLNVDTDVRIREITAAECAEQATKVARDKGLSVEVVEAIRASVLGVAGSS